MRVRRVLIQPFRETLDRRQSGLQFRLEVGYRGIARRQLGLQLGDQIRLLVCAGRHTQV